jgi:hypothetical protein
MNKKKWIFKTKFIEGINIEIIKPFKPNLKRD